MYRNALIAYRVAAAPFFAAGPDPAAQWRRKAGDYGADAALFRTILEQAIRDWHDRAAEPAA